MTTAQRAFSGEADLRAMADLVHRFPAGNLRAVDLPYRLSSWAFDDPANVGLWTGADGQLLGWAVLQTPFWAIDYATHPDAGASLRREILAWADRRAREALNTSSGQPAWFVEILADQSAQIRDLEDAEFANQADMGEDSWSKVLMECPAAMPVAAAALPAGFVVRPLAGEREVDAYVELHRAVFETRNMTSEWRARTLQRPEYVPDLDLVAVAPDGSLAAFCICWLHRQANGTAIGQIEPMGVRAEHRRQGLGHAILAEGLRRLRCHGADPIYVETDNYRGAALELYESAGFQVIQNVWVYGKDYSGTRES